MRRQALRRDGYLCQECGAMATDVDHVVPLRDGGAAFALENLRSLCHPCHSRKTSGETLHP